MAEEKPAVERGYGSSFFFWSLIPRDRNDAVGGFCALIAGVSLILGIYSFSYSFESSSDAAIARVVFWNITPMAAGLAFTMPSYPYKKVTPLVVLGLLVFLAGVTAIFATFFSTNAEGLAAGLSMTGVSFLFLAPLAFLSLRRLRPKDSILLGFITTFLILPCVGVAIAFGVRIGTAAQALFEDPNNFTIDSVSDFAPLYKTMLIYPAAATIVCLLIGFLGTWSGFFRSHGVADTSIPSQDLKSKKDDLAEQERAEQVRRLKIENDLKELELARMRSAESAPPDQPSKTSDDDRPKGKRSK